MTRSSSRRPRDLNQLAASLVEDTVREVPAEPVLEDPDEARRLRENGRRGGLKGGRARADKLSAEERSEIAKKAAQARWGSSELG
ncbi:MAG: histone H1 [Actinobacteria bacterium]|nr:histone H1 [Actinomycetota bacterium]